MKPPKQSLTATQIKYIQMYADGLSVPQIAEKQRKTPFSVDGHLKTAKKFMGAERLGHLVAICIRKNIIN
jgi:DNA-binding CsgD family transcriptional regulator